MSKLQRRRRDAPAGTPALRPRLQDAHGVGARLGVRALGRTAASRRGTNDELRSDAWQATSRNWRRVAGGGIGHVAGAVSTGGWTGGKKGDTLVRDF